VIRSVVLNGVNGSRLSSPIGRDAAFVLYVTKYHCIILVLQNSTAVRVFFERLKSEVSTDQLDLANALREAILIRDGVLSLYDCRFHRDDFVSFINECSI
jgi:hypothetical protein